MNLSKIRITAPVNIDLLIDHFKSKLASSDYKSYISILVDGEYTLQVVIKKITTSSIGFVKTESEDSHCALKVQEADISFVHKKYIPDVIGWIKSQVEALGGTLDEAKD